MPDRYSVPPPLTVAEEAAAALGYLLEVSYSSADGLVWGRCFLPNGEILAEEDRPLSRWLPALEDDEHDVLAEEDFDLWLELAERQSPATVCY